jgi:hypothetical protein
MPRLRPRASKDQKSPEKNAGSSKERRSEKDATSTPLTPVDEKIGEGDGNLRSREDAFQRRRGTTS